MVPCSSGESLGHNPDLQRYYSTVQSTAGILCHQICSLHTVVDSTVLLMFQASARFCKATCVISREHVQVIHKSGPTIGRRTKHRERMAHGRYHPLSHLIITLHPQTSAVTSIKLLTGVPLCPNLPANASRYPHIMALRLGIGDTLTLCKGAIDLCSTRLHDEPEDSRRMIADMCLMRSHLQSLSKKMGDERDFVASRPDMCVLPTRRLTPCGIVTETDSNPE